MQPPSYCTLCPLVTVVTGHSRPLPGLSLSLDESSPLLKPASTSSSAWPSYSQPAPTAQTVPSPCCEQGLSLHTTVQLPSHPLRVLSPTCTETERGVLTTCFQTSCTHVQHKAHTIKSCLDTVHIDSHATYLRDVETQTAYLGLHCRVTQASLKVRQAPWR